MEQEYLLTKSGYERLKLELEDLMTRETAQVADMLAEAREDEQGEEAFFYDVMVAKERLEERIARLQEVLARARIIEDDEDPDSITPGNRVTVYDMDEKEEFSFDLLSSTEIASGRRGVSTESPVGKGLLGHKVGDKVKIDVPDGVVRYKIRRIEMIPDRE